MKQKVMAGLFLLITLTALVLSGFRSTPVAVADEPTPTPTPTATEPPDPGKGTGGTVGG